MTIEAHFPVAEPLTLDQLLERLPRDLQHCAEPFEDDSVAFCETVSRELSRVVGPAWAAAAFFFRRAAIEQLRRDWYGPRGGSCSARGLVFHVTPGNVETQFLYSWLLSVLAGNANIVRISSKLEPAALEVLHRLGERIQVSAFARIRASNRIVSYGHDDLVTGALSTRCDVRILWGGDQAISQIRASPLRPGATEVAFPDRFSLAVIDSAGFLALPETEQAGIARNLVNDVWTFDQMACSSPKALVWKETAREADQAARRLTDLVVLELEHRQVRVALVTAMEKLRFGLGLLADGRARRARRVSNELVLIEADALDPLRDASWGGGALVEIRVGDMAGVERLLRPEDQTLTYAAFGEPDLERLVSVAKRAGLRRVVPFGRALAFSHVWDGIDLLAAMTKVLVVERRARSGGDA